MGKTKDIRAAVEAELRLDPLVDAAGITVNNIGGNVTLNGTVPSFPQYLEAAAAAGRVAEVTGVHNHLEVVLPRGDERDDAMLAAAANNTLARSSTVSNTVQATVRDGNLTLAGFVRNGAQRAAAEQAVADLPGVRNVRDQIEVISGDPLSDVNALVQDALDRYAVPLDNSKGDGQHQRTHRHAHRARAYPGRARRRGRRRLDGPRVSDVHDQIQVTS